MPNLSEKYATFAEDPQLAKFLELEEVNDHLSKIQSFLGDKKDRDIENFSVFAEDKDMGVFNELLETNELLNSIELEVSRIKVEKGDKGEAGYSPVKGKDYFTKEEIEDFKNQITPIRGKDFLTEEEVKKIKEELKPILGSDYLTAEDLKKIKNEIIPIKNKDFFDGKDGATGKPPANEELIALIEPLIPTPIKGERGEKGEAGRLPIAGLDFPLPKDGKDGEAGEIGPMPKHQWQGTNLRFESAPGVWGRWVHLGSREDKILYRGGINLVDDEIPTGTIDGVNAVFALTQTPVSGSVKVYLNGARQKLTDDYTIFGKTITFIIAPMSGSNLLVDYRT